MSSYNPIFEFLLEMYPFFQGKDHKQGLPVERWLSYVSLWLF
jgi:hypothetical protein